MLETVTDWLYHATQIRSSVIFVGLFSIYYFYYKYATSYWTRVGIKGPKPLPFIGNTWMFFFKPLFQVEHELIKQYGRIVGIYRSTKPSLIIADPEVIKTILVNDFHILPESFTQVYQHPLERKFLTALWGPEWKRVRTLVSPTFTTGKLKKMFNLLRSCLDKRLISLNEQLEKSDTIELKEFWGQYNMDVIAKCCFATDLNIYDNANDEMIYNFEAIFRGSKFGALVNLFSPDKIIKLLKASFVPKQSLNYLEDLARSVIENRKQTSDQSRYDFLQMLIEAEIIDETSDDGKQKLTADEIIATACIFLLAGYETTSTLLTWTCYELARNPEIQEKLYQEINCFDELSYENVNSAVFLEAVINEALRKHPPIVQFPRVSHGNYNVPGTRAILPSGSKIAFSVYALHHDAQFWPEPEVFNPDRFLPQNKNSIVPYSFIPFGGGPKLCIGQRFALINAKLSLSSILKQYQFVKNTQTTDKLDFIYPSIILSAKQVKVGIKKR